MRRVRRFATGVGALPRFEAGGRLVTIALCLVVGAMSLAGLVENTVALISHRAVPGLVRDYLLTAGTLGASLIVIAGLLHVVNRAGGIWMPGAAKPGPILGPCSDDDARPGFRPLRCRGSRP